MQGVPFVIFVRILFVRCMILNRVKFEGSDLKSPSPIVHTVGFKHEDYSCGQIAPTLTSLHHSMRHLHLGRANRIGILFCCCVAVRVQYRVSVCDVRCVGLSYGVFVAGFVRGASQGVTDTFACGIRTFARSPLACTSDTKRACRVWHSTQHTSSWLA